MTPALKKALTEFVALHDMVLLWHITAQPHARNTKQHAAEKELYKKRLQALQKALPK